MTFWSEIELPEKNHPWTRGQADLLFDAAAGGMLPQTCGDSRLPDLATVLRWVGSDPALHQAYHLAVRLRGFALLDDILTCARGATPRSLPEARRTLRALKKRLELCGKDKISATFTEGYSQPPAFKAMVNLLDEYARHKRTPPAWAA